MTSSEKPLDYEIASGNLATLALLFESKTTPTSDGSGAEQAAFVEKHKALVDELRTIIDKYAVRDESYDSKPIKDISDPPAYMSEVRGVLGRALEEAADEEDRKSITDFAKIIWD